MCTDTDKYIDRVKDACSVITHAEAFKQFAPLKVVEDKHKNYYAVHITAKEKWTFTMAVYGGLPNVAVSTQFLIEPEYRGRGWSELIDAVKVQVARALDCHVIFASVRADNAAELASIIKRGWHQIAYVPAGSNYLNADAAPHLMFMRKA